MKKIRESMINTPAQEMLDRMVSKSLNVTVQCCMTSAVSSLLEKYLDVVNPELRDLVCHLIEQVNKSNKEAESAWQFANGMRDNLLK